MKKKTKGPILFLILTFAPMWLHPGPLSFPPKIGSLSLMRLISGKEAVSMVNRLHRKKIPVVSAWVAEYITPGGKMGATVWVSEAKTAKEARFQVDAMVKSIESGKTPFKSIRKRMKSGIELYEFSGMGLEHALFRKDRMVFWVEAFPGVFRIVEEAFLNQ